MNERIQGTGKFVRVYKGGSVRVVEKELHEVLSEDMRTVEFSGTFEECISYLRSLCPNGKCEN